MQDRRANEILSELIERFGGMMTLADIAWTLGHKDTRQAKLFAEGVPSYVINGRQRWRTTDIARRIASARLEDDIGIY